MPLPTLLAQVNDPADSAAFVPQGKEAKVARQAGVVGYRWVGNSLRFCLIASRNGRRWLLPKGTVEPGEPLYAAALREAWEEAGVQGYLVGFPLEPLRDDKPGKPRLVQLHLMEIARVADDWPEAFRRRSFVDLRTALRLLGRRNPYRDALRQAARRLLSPLG
mgnify:CR=1 FL=1